jgi:hypothetical protein
MGLSELHAAGVPFEQWEWERTWKRGASGI